MVIPRERRLVRLYIQLADVRVGKGERFDRPSVTPDMIFRAAQKILHPYSIAYEYCEWWTIYQVSVLVVPSRQTSSVAADRSIYDSSG
jgi:hypothetical protein